MRVLPTGSRLTRSTRGAGGEETVPQGLVAQLGVGVNAQTQGNEQVARSAHFV